MVPKNLNGNACINKAICLTLLLLGKLLFLSVKGKDIPVTVHGGS
jgi:hypothetical protein